MLPIYYIYRVIALVMIKDMQRKGAKGKTGLPEIQQTMMPNRQAMNKKKW